MQTRDESKRRLILEKAARLFATRPFHEVRLEDVAAEAHVGKGTLYVYFNSKQDLHAAMLHEGFAHLVDQIRAHVDAEDDALTTFKRVIRQLVTWACQNPTFWELMKGGGDANEQLRPATREQRRRLGQLIETVIRRGNAEGVFGDPNPALTAQFIPAAVRSAFKWVPGGVSPERLTRHLHRVFLSGIQAGAER